jgi:hypothetical protein
MQTRLNFGAVGLQLRIQRVSVANDFGPYNGIRFLIKKEGLWMTRKGCDRTDRGLLGRGKPCPYENNGCCAVCGAMIAPSL